MVGTVLQILTKTMTCCIAKFGPVWILLLCVYGAWGALEDGSGISVDLLLSDVVEPPSVTPSIGSLEISATEEEPEEPFDFGIYKWGTKTINNGVSRLYISPTVNKVFKQFLFRYPAEAKKVTEKAEAEFQIQRKLRHGCIAKAYNVVSRRDVLMIGVSVKECDSSVSY